MQRATFREILDEKLKKTDKKPISEEPVAESYTFKMAFETLFSPQFVDCKRVSGRHQTVRDGYPKGSNSSKSRSPLKSRHAKAAPMQFAVQHLSHTAQMALTALGIDSENISQIDVRRAFYRLARHLHPDVVRAKDQTNNESYLCAQQAYELLTQELTKLARQKATTASGDI